MNKIVIRSLIIVFYYLITISFQGCGRQGITVVYKFDAFGLVDTALAYRGESLIAKAEKIAIHPVERPIIIDIEVMETYFDYKTGELTL